MTIFQQQDWGCIEVNLKLIVDSSSKTFSWNFVFTFLAVGILSFYARYLTQQSTILNAESQCALLVLRQAKCFAENSRSS